MQAAGPPTVLPNDIAYAKVLVDLENCDNIYALSVNGRVYRSINNAASWELLTSVSTTFNVADIVSFFTNFLFVGTTGLGIIRIDNALRDKIRVDIIADGNIVFFDIDFLEMGDTVDTDVNSIIANTLVKNDSISNNIEQVRFKTDDVARDIQFSITNNDIPFGIDDIFVGDAEQNPNTNPFFLRTPGIEDDPSVINQIVALPDGNLYAATNRGFFITENFGGKWNKFLNAALPDEILNIGLVQDGELALATSNGVWASSNNRQNFGIIESSGQRINTLFESTERNIRSFFRGGENGLRVSVENSRSVIAYSGLNTQVKFSWGDIFDPKDGGWSENTQRVINNPIFRPTRPGSTQLTEFKGWDHALIVRKGPFTTFEKAFAAAEADDIFAPQSQVVYPDTLSTSYNTPTSVAVFFTDDPNTKRGLEEVRNINLAGSNAVGVSFDPQRFMSDGSIIVGRVPNRKRSVSDYPEEFDFGPNPDFPIIDKIQPLIDNRNIPENFSDPDAYEAGEVRAPVLKDNMFYLYRVYPYLLIPEPFAITTDDEDFPTLPDYRPDTGDLPDAYNYNLEVDDFTGGVTTVLSGIPIGENNWIIGTDSGVFYSTQAGRDPNPAEDQDVVGSGFTIPALILTSAGIAIAAVVSQGVVYLARSTEVPLGRNWEIITSTIQAFSSANVRRIYNITEDANGFLHLSTNAGIFRGDSTGDNWVLFGTVGDLEALSDGKLLGQEFEVK